MAVREEASWREREEREGGRLGMESAVRIVVAAQICFRRTSLSEPLRVGAMHCRQREMPKVGESTQVRSTRVIQCALRAA